MSGNESILPVLVPRRASSRSLVKALVGYIFGSLVREFRH